MKNIKNTIDHLKNHQGYPATKEELVVECNSLSDFSGSDKMWFSEHLTEGTYKSPGDVLNALGLKEQAMRWM